MSSDASKMFATVGNDGTRSDDEEPVQYYEPLKACLDSDSDNSLGDDDDFFYGDDENEFMEYEVPTFHPSSGVAFYQGRTLEIKTVVMPSARDAATSGKEQDQSAQQTTIRSHGDQQSTSAISDEGSSNSSSIVSFDSMARPSSSSSSLASTARSFSTGCILQESTSDSNEKAGQKRKRRRVALNDVVTVIPIPERDEYSARTRSKLWSTAEELYTNAARNGVEFASEGWNWRTVAEDEHMILCNKESGERELVHPIHIHNLLVERGILQAEEPRGAVLKPTPCPPSKASADDVKKASAA